MVVKYKSMVYIDLMKVYFNELPITKSPVCSYCRKLIADGADPNTALEIYRDHDDPDLIVNHIGKAAELTIEENEKRGPRYVKYEAFPGLVVEH